MSNATKLVCEVGKRQLIKHGEVTCGDSVEVVYTPETIDEVSYEKI